MELTFSPETTKISASGTEAAKAASGETIASCASALDLFCFWFKSGEGLVLKAEKDDDGIVDEINIGIYALSADAMPRPGQAVCSVDWSWIYGKEILSLDKSNVPSPTVKLKLDNVTITVSVGIWQGKPFLSFMPYKPPV
jgi:hypothetical protein